MSNQGALVAQKASASVGNGAVYGLKKNWCARFVWKTAQSVGVPASIVPHDDYTPTMQAFFSGQKRYYLYGSHTPQPGDIAIIHTDKGANRPINHVGIVTGSNGNKVYTVEGNINYTDKKTGKSVSRVVAETYTGGSRKGARILGFGVPKYNTAVEPGGDYGDQNLDITYDIIKEISPGTRVEYADLDKLDNLDHNYEPTGDLRVFVGKNRQNMHDIAQIPVAEDVTWELTLEGSPGRVTFSCVKEIIDKSEGVNIEMGDPVRICAGERDVFFGYVFAKRSTKDGKVEITAYDQLRYFANVNTYRYVDLTASELLMLICQDYDLKPGAIEDTGVKLSAVEDSKSLFDMMRFALNETKRLGDEMFVLYDDFRKIRLRNIRNMKLDYVLTAAVAEDYDYESTIEESANYIQIGYDNHDIGAREITLVQDRASIAKWGRLDKYEVRDRQFEMDTYARGVYHENDIIKRRLKVTNAIGDLRVRPGSRIIVSLELEDMKVEQMMMVWAVTHRFGESKHFMDLTLVGGAEFVE